MMKVRYRLMRREQTDPFTEAQRVFERGLDRGP
jgi:hypothetical protein